MNKTFRVVDTGFHITAETGERDKAGFGWRPDWETYNRLRQVLAEKGFVLGLDPWVDSRWPTLNKTHGAGRHGDLQVHFQVYPTGCEFKFFQELVHENPNGGRHDFHKLQKMPYLIRKRFEGTAAAIRAHLSARGFTENELIDSPNPDPLAYFNAKWDGEYERRRGTRRFSRDETGWPDSKELSSWDRRDRDGELLQQGDIRYGRSWSGHLLRGRCFGGINGMWLFVYGPGSRDFTQMHAKQLFSCRPSELPRRDWLAGGYGGRSAAKRVAEEKARAVRREDFERAARLRDVLAGMKSEPQEVAA